MALVTIRGPGRNPEQCKWRVASLSGTRDTNNTRVLQITLEDGRRLDIKLSGERALEGLRWMLRETR